MTLFWALASQEIATAIRRTFGHFLLGHLWTKTVGGGSIDPKTNSQLAAAVKKAKDQGVPRENIEKAIAKVKTLFSPWSSSIAWLPCTVGKQSKGERRIACKLWSACVQHGWDYNVSFISWLQLFSGHPLVVRETVTDNANRTIHGLREILNSHRFVQVPHLMWLEVDDDAFKYPFDTSQIHVSTSRLYHIHDPKIDWLLWRSLRQASWRAYIFVWRKWSWRLWSSPVRRVCRSFSGIWTFYWLPSHSILILVAWLPRKIFCEPQDLKNIENLIVSWKDGLKTTIEAVESTDYVAVDPTQVDDDMKEKVEKLKHDLQVYDDSLKVWTTLDTL